MARDAIDMLCAVLELEKRERRFYEEAEAACPDPVGKEVFRMLLAEEEDHAAHVEALRRRFETGEGWSEACLLEGPSADAAAAVRHVAERHAEALRRGMDKVAALGVGIEMEAASAAFYEGLLEKAKDPFERRFLEEMARAERRHHLILTDLQYYYEDPEGYFMEKEHRGLDGA
ncbi:ferritin family protein [Dissulfurirhabdus thermomarina]|uniref:Ferritin family protein n=1 Tax=Dissulfurirhabdus thermomarina TaxID=1765737 RepID=A0A6N9TUW2_DISTH|nr:ferritin family protein [Dissulfurirhabdus thermomarina]NDY42296.1 ferritin family protein [Dissulfurirhabdus thermomarina]NMX24155.1 ferritin family protein [Dissulfurirhabdus thermomarina]